MSRKQLDLFDLSFLALIDQIKPEPAIACKVSTQWRNAILWGPEALILASSFRREWGRLASHIVYDIKLLFDLSRGISVRSRQVRENLRKLKGVGKELWESVERSVESVLEATADRSMGYLQANRARKSLEDWQQELVFYGLARVQQQIQHFPQYVAVSEIERMVIDAKNKEPKFARSFGRLSERIEERLDAIADIHVGRVWNWVAIEFAYRESVKRYMLSGESDLHRCAVCEKYAGKIFQIDTARLLMKTTMAGGGMEMFPRLGVEESVV